jgi:hypothetical protein
MESILSYDNLAMATAMMALVLLIQNEYWMRKDEGQKIHKSVDYYSQVCELRKWEVNWRGHKYLSFDYERYVPCEWQGVRELIDVKEGISICVISNWNGQRQKEGTVFDHTVCWCFLDDPVLRGKPAYEIMVQHRGAGLVYQTTDGRYIDSKTGEVYKDLAEAAWHTAMNKIKLARTEG